jgi:hypothetical protein
VSTATTVDELSGARRRGPLAVSGAVYVVAWLLGLATAPSAPDSDAGDAAIQSFYSGRGGATLLQATLVHAVAGVALAVFVVALARRLASDAPSRERSVLLAAGLGAAAVSLVQYGMEIALNRAAHAGHVSASATLFHAVNVADTMKLVLLAVAIAAATRLAARTAASPRRLLALGHALTPLLVLGGAAFIVTSDALAAVLALSLIVLLVWVVAVAVVLSRTRAVAACGAPVCRPPAGSTVGH